MEPRYLRRMRRRWPIGTRSARAEPRFSSLTIFGWRPTGEARRWQRRLSAGAPVLRVPTRRDRRPLSPVIMGQAAREHPGDRSRDGGTCRDTASGAKAPGEPSHVLTKEAAKIGRPSVCPEANRAGIDLRPGVASVAQRVPSNSALLIILRVKPLAKVNKYPPKKMPSGEAQSRQQPSS